MGKKDVTKTPRGQIRSAIRALFLRSRERSYCIKTAKYTCAECGAKQSKAKGKEVAVCCHHINGIEKWEQLIDMIYEEVLCRPEFLQCLCVGCHDKHKQGVEKNDEHDEKP